MAGFITFTRFFCRITASSSGVATPGFMDSISASCEVPGCTGPRTLMLIPEYPLPLRPLMAFALLPGISEMSFSEYPAPDSLLS